jgi:flagellar basal-body rod protein FlgB
VKASSVTDLLFQNLHFRGEKQKIISSNIANINTPGYKTKDVSFENELKRATANNDLKLKVTHPNHISFENEQISPSKFNTFEVQDLEEQNDGNNVNLDTQMSNMAKNSIMFSAIQGSIKKDAAWFKEVIAASGKN